jgi:hypothetical protein
MTVGRLLTIAIGIIEWTIAILSVVGTVALVGWILKMFIQKDKPDEPH